MKKFVMPISIILNVVLLIFALPLIVNLMQTSCMYHPSAVKDKKTTMRVALLTPASHPSLEKIEQGFKDTLANFGKHHYVCDVFNAGGNRTLLRAQAEEIVQKDYDLIFTIATQPSQLIKELCTKKGKKTPIVFGAADEPENLGLVSTLQKPGGFMTGVVETPHYEEQIKLLKLLKPNIKNILLVYNPAQGSGLEKHKHEYEKILVGAGIELRILEVLSLNEVYTKLAATIAGNDAVLILKDNTVVPAMDSVIKLCSQYHVTLMASDLDSGDKGAALSFGVHEDQFGIQGAHLSLKILEEGASPSTLACVDAGKHQLKINTKTMNQQGLAISEILMDLLKSVTIV